MFREFKQNAELNHRVRIPSCWTVQPEKQSLPFSVLQRGLESVMGKKLVKALLRHDFSLVEFMTTVEEEKYYQAVC